MKKELNVNGMTCHSCEMMIKEELEELDGVISVLASSKDNKVIVDYNESKINLDKIKEVITEEGYKV